MNIGEVVSALNSVNRRQILRILSKYRGFPSDSLTVRELILELKQNPAFNIKHRESIYKALKILVEADLVEKQYHTSRGMCYRIIKTRLELDLVNEEIQ